MTYLARDEYLQSMRLMAWERAKGELRGIGHTSYSSGDSNREESMAKFFMLLSEFIRAVEDGGLIE